MNTKFKALSLGALAVLAIVALGSGSATATTGGHFASGEHALVKTVDNAQHSYAFNAHSGEVQCSTFNHQGTIAGTTATSIDLVPNYVGCGTEGGSGTAISAYTYNGCVYRLTVAAKTTSSTEQTIDFVCPTGKVLEFHQPNCLATMPPQTVVNAATYTPIEVNGKHALTLDLHATFETQYHGGLCVFLGTKQFATLQGSTTLVATNAFGQPVSLTAT